MYSRFNMKIIIDVQKTNKVLSESVGEFKTKLLDQLAHNTKTLFEKNTPKKRGFGSRNYHVLKSLNTREIRNDTYYLPWVNDGTGIYGPLHHRITPKHAKVLHFYWKGNEWFLKSVKGQKGKHFVERSMTEVIRSVDSAVVIASRGTLK